jgi:deazaflavin-dependent oxidoreductase (nitroreductase family)
MGMEATMGASLCDQLGYVLPRPNAVQRALRVIPGSVPGAWVLARTMPAADRFLQRVSKGRTSLPGVLAGLPPLMVTMTGAKSGLKRTVPLIGVPFDGDIVLIGTRFGQQGTPAWYFNLRKTPEVELEFEGRKARAVASEVTGQDWQRAWDAGVAAYSGYAAYARRIKDREVHIMRLSAAL